jgi:hypothetical protein
MKLQPFLDESFLQYLGDQVYIDFDGYHIVLMTYDGIRVKNRVFLDSQVIGALDDYVSALADMVTAYKAKKKAKQEE